MEPTRIFRLALALGFYAVLGTYYLALAADTMSPKTTDQEGFEVIGIEARTNNAKESSDGGMIPQMWQRFYMEGTINQIPNKVDKSIIAVYTDYVSDANGDYTYILGARVKPGSKAPAGMVAKQIPTGKYLDFDSEQGALPLVVPKVWRHIAEYFQATGAPARVYKADYEVYDAAMDPNDASTHVFVGVK